MAVKKLSESEVKTYLEMLMERGEHGLYKRCISMGVMRLASGVKNPEIELLDLSEAFFVAFRRNGDDILFTIGKVLRRSAHVLYRNLHKNVKNIRFLQVVR